MKDLHESKVLVRDTDNKYFLSDDDSNYFYAMKLEPVSLTQQEFWLIISEYIDGTLGVNVSGIGGTFNHKQVNKNKVALTSDDLVQLAGSIDKISSITLTVKHVEDSSITVRSNGTVQVEYASNKGLSPFIEDVLDTIPTLLEGNYKDKHPSVSEYRWNY